MDPLLVLTVLHLERENFGTLPGFTWMASSVQFTHPRLDSALMFGPNGLTAVDRCCLGGTKTKIKVDIKGCKE